MTAINLQNIDTFDLIKAYSLAIKNDRSNETIYEALVGEAQELKEEIDNGGKGVDGISGESVDVILCAGDMLVINDTSISVDEFKQIIYNKLEKWRTVYSSTSIEDVIKHLPVPPEVTLSDLAIAEEIFSAAQLKEGEGVYTAQKRIAKILKKHESRKIALMNEAIQNAIGLLDTPIMRRKLGYNPNDKDSFITQVIKSIYDASAA